ncbi:hypothetical protein [Sphingomonas morindae]|uniref:Uncharacterized protein n=1 Tax=Sphingomonas morindae TaxID=1541170 RepID=A0ABY4X969_9SPHN|nr:hypothetical protein [Sphingomonas morindae]USI73477.1 hypothetical protein LHA26_03060 [Sphingomonas morindae]
MGTIRLGRRRFLVPHRRRIAALLTIGRRQHTDVAQDLPAPGGLELRRERRRRRLSIPRPDIGDRVLQPQRADLVGASAQEAGIGGDRARFNLVGALVSDKDAVRRPQKRVERAAIGLVSLTASISASTDFATPSGSRASAWPPWRITLAEASPRARALISRIAPGSMVTLKPVSSSRVTRFALVTSRLIWSSGVLPLLEPRPIVPAPIVPAWVAA